MVTKSRLIRALILIAVTVSSLSVAAGPALAVVGGANTALAAQNAPPDPPGGWTVGPYGPQSDPQAWAKCEAVKADYKKVMTDYDFACFAHDDNQVYLAVWPKKNDETWLSGFSQNALEVYHSSLLSGSAVDEWQYNGSATQWWVRYRTPSGHYRLINRNSGLCLGVQGGSFSSGAKVVQWQCNDNLDQDWSFQYAGLNIGGWPVYQISNVNSWLCLDDPHGSTANGTQLQQYFCNGTSSQYWR